MAMEVSTATSSCNAPAHVLSPSWQRQQNARHVSFFAPSSATTSAAAADARTTSSAAGIGRKVILRASLRTDQQDRCPKTRTESALSRRSAILHTAFALCGGSLLLTTPRESQASIDRDFQITKKVFFDIAIDGQPVGEVVVGLYGSDVPIGAQRFAELAIGQKGIGYRKKEFGKITPYYIQNNGIRAFSLSGGVSDAVKITGGDSNKDLAEEMAELSKKGALPRNVTGAVSLYVVDPTKPPAKTKLVARNGKFVVLEEEIRPDPNGTEFMIVTADSPQLDSSNLVVGRVLQGYDVIQKIGQVKVVTENTGSPYFQTAKLIGDSRAVVAEKGFFRPYSKIVITKSGELT